MEFFFTCSTQYLTNDRSEQVRHQDEHENGTFISQSNHALFFFTTYTSYSREEADLMQVSKRERFPINRASNMSASDWLFKHVKNYHNCYSFP